MADISKLKTPDGTTYSLKDETARAGKQNIRNGTISGNVNWNTLTTAGTYKIQNPPMAASLNAPVGEYAFGILIVFDSESGGENRLMQIYFPHNPSKNYMYIRMRNMDSWTEWKGLSKDADTVDGYHVADGNYSDIGSVPPVYFTDIARINHDKKTIERWDTGNLGVAFANSATNADTVDGKHASDFAEASHTHNYAGETSGGFMSADDKIKLDGLSKITVEHFDATTDEWSHVSLFATGGKIPIAAVFSYNTVMYSIFVYNGYYYISAYDTSMNAIPNTAVSFDLICKEG